MIEANWGEHPSYMGGVVSWFIFWRSEVTSPLHGTPLSQTSWHEECGLGTS